LANWRRVGCVMVLSESGGGRGRAGGLLSHSRRAGGQFTLPGSAGRWPAVAQNSMKIMKLPASGRHYPPPEFGGCAIGAGVWRPV